MKKSLILFLTLICAASWGADKNETVVLIHGLARSSKSMDKMERILSADGYRVINVDYDSNSAPIETLTAQIFEEITPQLNPEQPLHIVTHSMGGIITRLYLTDHKLPQLQNVVMLAPPSKGSEVTDKLHKNFIYRWLNGPAGNQLTTDNTSLPNQLPPPDFNLGIIGGDRSINIILSCLIPGPDDGKVSVNRVNTQGASDFLLLHVTHACMMWNKSVIRQTRHFLEHGRFERTKTEEPLLIKQESKKGMI